MVKWLAVGVGALLLVIAAALASLPWLVDTPAVHSHIAHALTSALGRPVSFASVSVRPFPLPTFTLRGLTVAEDPSFGPGPFVTVEQGKVRLRLRPLLSGRIELTELTLESPRITVLEDQTGRLNVATLGTPAVAPSGGARGGGRGKGSGAAAGALVSSIRIENGSVRYDRRAGRAPAVSLERIDLTVSRAASGEALQVRGQATLEPGRVKLSVKEATLTPTAARVLSDTAIAATVDVETSDVAPLAAVLLPAPALSGPVAGKVELAGTPAQLSATGALRLGRLTLAPTGSACGPGRQRPLVIDELHVPLAAAGGRIESNPVQARVARGTASFRAEVTLATGVVALRDIEVKGVQLAPILVDYLCQPYAVTGPLDLTGTATLRLGAGAGGIDGAGRLEVGRGTVVGRDVVALVRDVVGLGAAVAAATKGTGRASSPLDFDSITATYTIAGGVARTDDLLYRARDVKVTAAGTYRLADGRVAMELALTEGTNRIKGIVAGAPGSLRIVPTSVDIGDRDVRRFLDRLFR